jgi:protein-S-isoprenylcysteine O-methyltransferase Ste14
VVLAGLSWTLLWQSAATALVTVALAAYLDRKARYEERLLTQAFPEYTDYCRRVRRWLPFPVRNPEPGACR